MRKSGNVCMLYTEDMGIVINRARMVKQKDTAVCQ